MVFQFLIFLLKFILKLNLFLKTSVTFFNHAFNLIPLFPKKEGQTINQNDRCIKKKKQDPRYLRYGTASSNSSGASASTTTLGLRKQASRNYGFPMLPCCGRESIGQTDAFSPSLSTSLSHCLCTGCRFRRGCPRTLPLFARNRYSSSLDVTVADF